MYTAHFVCHCFICVLINLLIDLFSCLAACLINLLTYVNEMSIQLQGCIIMKRTKDTRMWANAQRDGRPDEHTVQCRKVWLTLTT